MDYEDRKCKAIQLSFMIWLTARVNLSEAINVRFAETSMITGIANLCSVGSVLTGTVRSAFAKGRDTTLELRRVTRIALRFVTVVTTNF
jgi:hypothetical protein